MSDKIFDWALDQVQVFWTHKVGAIVLILFGAVVGWRISAAFYAEQMTVLREKAGMKQATGADGEQAIRSVIIIELMNTTDMGFTTLNGGGLLDFSEDYDVMVVCGQSAALTDKFRDTRIAVSEPHTIVNARITANVPFRGSPLGEAMAQMHAATLAEFRRLNPTVILPPAVIVNMDVWREPVVVPKGTRTTDIRSLSDVRRIGGKILSSDVPVRIAEDPRRP